MYYEKELFSWVVSCGEAHIEWFERVLSKFEDGTYKPVPFLPSLPVHFVHQSTEKPGLVCYFRSVGARIPTQIKPGKYLQLAFPSLTGAEISDILSNAKEETAEDILITRDFGSIYILDSPTDQSGQGENFTVSSHDEDTLVMTNLYNSCMRHKFKSLRTHPANFYAGSENISLVYRKNDDGHLVARILVNTGKKICSQRIYADKTSSCRPIIAWLQERGYRVGDVLTNEIFTAIGTRNGRELIMPYIDDDEKGFDYDEATGEIYFTRRGSYTADSTGGVVSCGPEYSCDTCDCSLSEDEMYSDGNGSTYCQSCYEEIYTRCDHCENGINRDDACYGSEIVLCERCADRHYTRVAINICGDIDYVRDEFYTVFSPEDSDFEYISHTCTFALENRLIEVVNLPGYDYVYAHAVTIYPVYDLIKEDKTGEYAIDPEEYDEAKKTVRICNIGGGDYAIRLEQLLPAIQYPKNLMMIGA